MPNLASPVARWAAERPDAPAVEYREACISYRELDAGSSALAITLRGRGIGPGSCVGIWLRKSIESVVAVYGVLRAGAAYVPIDPIVPAGRARRMMADCEMACLITNGEQLGPLLCAPARDQTRFVVIAVGDHGGAGAGAQVSEIIDWDEAVTASAEADALRAVPDADPRSLAYILYTSGSQGDPKGVALSHANGRCFAEWAAAEFGLGPSDRVSGHAPLHFDLSVLDLFATSLAGACLVLVPESWTGLGGALNRLVADARVTVWYSVPNALTRMLGARNSALLAGSSLRTILFAGEPFNVSQLRELHRLAPAATLYNLYGPTETNVCTFHRLRATDLGPDRIEPPPIGRACPYASTFLIDQNGQLVAHEPGRTGELCVAGESVMPGYWRASELTAAKTVTICHDVAGPCTAYRTGDLVSIDADLNYVFRGRADDMVKIRGFRVALGEVESVLSGAPNVREVACAAVAGQDGEKRIEAFLVPGPELCDELQLRRHCLAALPRYMVPERFHVVTALPRTRTGKLDRRSLPCGS